MKTSKLHVPQTQQHAAGAGLALGLSGVVLSVILFGASTAVLDWDVQALVLTALVPALLLLWDYRLGLALLILMLPFENADFLPKFGPLNALNVLILGVVLSFLLRVVMRKLTPRPLVVLAPRTLLVFYVLLLTMAVIVGTTHFKEMTSYYLLKNFPDGYTLSNYWISHYFKRLLLVVVGCVVLASTVFAAGSGRRWIVIALLASMGFVVAEFVLAGSLGMSAEQWVRSRAYLIYLGRQNNEAGVMLVTAFGPLLFMREMVRSGFWRVVLTVCVLLMFGAIVLTGSRGAFVGMAVVVALYLLHFRRLRTAFAVVTLALIAAALAPDAVQERFLRGLENRRIESVDTRGDELTAGRGYVWLNLAPEVARSPLYGRGLMSTQWSRYVRSGAFLAGHPHNMYLEILMDTGLIGAVCMFIVYRWAWRSLRGLGKDERLDPDVRGYFLGAWAGFVGMLVYGIPGGHWYPVPEQTFFWLSLGMAVGYGRVVAGWPALERVAAPVRRGRRAVRRLAPERLEPALTPTRGWT